MPITVDPRNLYHSLSGELVIEKFEKYILLLLLTLLLTLIPFNAGKTPVYCNQPPIIPGNDSDAHHDELYASSESAAADKETDVVDEKDYSRIVKGITELPNSSQPDRTVRSSTKIAAENDVTEKITWNNRVNLLSYLFIRNTTGMKCDVVSESSENNVANTSTSLQNPIHTDKVTSPKVIQNASKTFEVYKEMSKEACPGKRAKDYVVWLGLCFVMFVGWTATLDMWLYRSEKEIKKLKKIVENNKIMKICDECMKSLLNQDLEEFCSDCNSRSTEDNPWSLKQALLRKQPKLDFLRKRYRQNAACNGVASFAAVLCIITRWSNYDHYWFDCVITSPQHHLSSTEPQKLLFRCYDARLDFVTATAAIMAPFLVGIFLLSVFKFALADDLNFEMFSALQNKHSSR